MASFRGSPSAREGERRNFGRVGRGRGRRTREARERGRTEEVNVQGGNLFGVHGPLEATLANARAASELLPLSLSPSPASSPNGENFASRESPCATLCCSRFSRRQYRKPATNFNFIIVLYSRRLVDISIIIIKQHDRVIEIIGSRFLLFMHLIRIFHYDIFIGINMRLLNYL